MFNVNSLFILFSKFLGNRNKKRILPIYVVEILIYKYYFTALLIIFARKYTAAAIIPVNTT